MDSFQLVEGRTVLLKIAEGEYRPAAVVKVWGSTTASAANLVVFLDGSNDDRYKGLQNGLGHTEKGALTAWATSRVHGDEIGQWITPQELFALRNEA